MSSFFCVAGNPIPKERPRFSRGHVYTPKKTVAYEKKIKAEALAVSGMHVRDGNVRIVLGFFRSSNRRCDLDNLIKSVKDALNGVAWNDDSQVVELEAFKAVDRANPRVEIYITG